MAVTFESWYLSYPRKDKKADARKAWGQALAKGFTPEQIQLSTDIAARTTWLDAMENAVRDGKRDKMAYIPLPASFLRGNEFEADERAEALEDDDLPPMEPKSHKHHCNGYGQHSPHDWECNQAVCIYPGLARCVQRLSGAKDGKTLMISR